MKNGSYVYHRKKLCRKNIFVSTFLDSYIDFDSNVDFVQKASQMNLNFMHKSIEMNLNFMHNSRIKPVSLNN